MRGQIQVVSKCSGADPSKPSSLDSFKDDSANRPTVRDSDKVGRGRDDQWMTRARMEESGNIDGAHLAVDVNREVGRGLSSTVGGEAENEGEEMVTRRCRWGWGSSVQRDEKRDMCRD